MKAKYFLPLLPLLSLLTACSTDEALIEPVPTGRISLVAAPLASSAGRAWNDPSAVDGEMMKRWCIVILDEENKVRALRTDRLADGNEVEKDQPGALSLPEGTYTALSFANFPYTAGDNKLTLGEPFVDVSFTLDEDCPALPERLPTIGNSFNMAAPQNANLAAPQNANMVAPQNANMAAPQNIKIPMTGRQTVKVSAEERNTLYVYRMLSKMTVDVRNLSGHSLKLTGITLPDYTPNAPALIPLFRQVDANGAAVVDLPAEMVTAPYDFYAPDDAPEITAGGETALTGYVNIAKAADEEPGYLRLNLSYTRIAADGMTREYTRNVLLPGLSQIARNEMVYLPLVMTDYEVEVRPFYYPPIGGYPAFEMREEVGCTYVFFNGAGDFALLPLIHRFGAPESEWISLLHSAHIRNYRFTVRDVACVLSRQPAVTATGEVMASLSGTAGTAQIELTLEIAIHPEQADSPTQTIVRTIYVVKK